MPSSVWALGVWHVESAPGVETEEFWHHTGESLSWQQGCHDVDQETVPEGNAETAHRGKASKSHEMDCKYFQRHIAMTQEEAFKDQMSSMLQETDVEAATEPVPLDKLVATVDNEAEEIQEGVSLRLEVTERRIQYAKTCDEMKKTAAVEFETACQPFVVQLPPLFAAACQDDEPARNQSTVAATENNLSKAEAGNQSAQCPQS
mmetsp:Transcript_8997/g.17190  ORF Transcript_8997/g.17190 Transcript_8997/m.17190 type:complete len:204 (-) Transcript_8997:129-740(-)|eukprot:CAMPEP_0172911536 /NCGR_PEP_ID=MMETSP1075-20121228/186705_1 /TAXON_ID=2916 /ORGANISM="Ceratium fusus, Strain PA161109" /LENGTH=203 /DNA_ID=CAMNT_0013769865 /DNA_START=259 /DNA_END=870 /DNA_ORIENTATION=-